MKKKLLLICLMLSVGLLIQANPDENSGFAFKLSVGGGNTMGGDMPALVDGLNGEFADMAVLMGAAEPEKIHNANLGPEFEAELQVSVFKGFDVGIGVGYIIRDRDSESALIRNTRENIRVNWNPSYRIIPILLSGYYRIPLSSGTQLSLRAGGGYYFMNGDLNLRLDEQTVSDGNFWEVTDVSTSKNGFGFHGGVILNQSITRNISLFFELGGRYVQHKDWDVEAIETDSTGATEKETGTFWYHDEYKPATNKVYESLTVSEEKPNLPRSTGIRKAVIGLSGIAIKIGLKINLG